MSYVDKINGEYKIAKLNNLEDILKAQDEYLRAYNNELELFSKGEPNLAHELLDLFEVAVKAAPQIVPLHREMLREMVVTGIEMNRSMLEVVEVNKDAKRLDSEIMDFCKDLFK